jgi:hypothetical protein
VPVGIRSEGWLLSALLALAACDGPKEPADAGVDAAIFDAGNGEEDAGEDDAGEDDAGEDAGDDGGRDAGSFDPDAGRGDPDAGRDDPDGGRDAGNDAGRDDPDGGRDAGMDAGRDAGPPPVLLTVVLRGEGTGRVTGAGIDCTASASSDCTELVAHGEEVMLTATAELGSSFGGWDGAMCAGTSCSVVLTAGQTVEARFDAVFPTLTVAVTGEGSVSSAPAGIDCGADCSEAYTFGADVTLTATPDRSGVRFYRWGGACDGLVDCTVSMTEARHVTAEFEVITYRVGVAVAGDGRVTSDVPGIDCRTTACFAWFDAGTVLTLTASPDYRSTFQTWSDASCTGLTCTFTVDSDIAISAGFLEHPATGLSTTDRDPLLRVRSDLLAADFYDAGGVRSARAITPGSGVYYFEAHRLIDDVRLWGVGVATASAPLTGTFVGATAQSFGASADGSFLYEGNWLGRVFEPNDTFGFVVDYRSTSPVVYVIMRAPDASWNVAPRVVRTQALPAITTPLYVFLAGNKREPDWHVEINVGNDTTNTPFTYDARALLRAAGHDAVADALVLGWGDTYAGPLDSAPIMTVPHDRTVVGGTLVTLEATAIDAEQGNLGATIEWELLSSPHYAGRISTTGTSFSFSPHAIGIHPARARVTDRAGHVVERIVRVTVEGPVAQYTPVRLVPDALSGTGIELAPDGLSARWTGFGKMGVRANQSNYGHFWYFEIHRLVDPVNMGGGLVPADGNLDPYSWVDIPGSCSINTSGAAWRDLVWQGNFPAASSTYSYYGFAVDYRGEHPIVYVILGGEVIQRLELEDVWVEIYPVLYGNPTDLTVAGEFDEAINFGATPFHYDAAAALTAYGVSTAGFEAGWGDVNTP